MDKNTENELVKNLIDGVFYVDLERKITLWNRAAERISGYSSAEVVGQCCDRQMLEYVDSEGRRLCDEDCPLTTTMKDGTCREVSVFLHNKKGYRVPVTVRTTPIKASNGAITGCIETFAESYAQSQVLQELWQTNEVGMTDLLVGVGNERFCEINLSTRIYEFNTFNVGFGVILIDLDLFKNIITTYGEKTGDDVLIMIARTLSGVMRKLDIITRPGNDKFVIIVPNMPADVLKKVTDRLRILVKNSFFESNDAKIAVTASMGATMVKVGDTPASILGRVHSLADESKALGRDRVTIG